MIVFAICLSADYRMANDSSARATSAAPPYFRPFHSQRSGKEYVDGAVYHNNPVKVAEGERKALWPGIDYLDPDLLLSIGSGKCPIQLAKATGKYENQEDRRMWSSLVPKLLKVLFARMNDDLDSEAAWSRFMYSLARGSDTQRYVRLNPELSDLPALDDKKKLPSLEIDVRTSLLSMDTQIRDVADRLLASCFYFEKAEVRLLDNRVTGKSQW